MSEEPGCSLRKRQRVEECAVKAELAMKAEPEPEPEPEPVPVAVAVAVAVAVPVPVREPVAEWMALPAGIMTMSTTEDGGTRIQTFQSCIPVHEVYEEWCKLFPTFPTVMKPKGGHAVTTEEFADSVPVELDARGAPRVDNVGAFPMNVYRLVHRALVGLATQGRGGKLRIPVPRMDVTFSAVHDFFPVVRLRDGAMVPWGPAD